MINRALPGLLLLVLVGLPASAQSTDRPTGLAPAQSSFSPDDLPTYIRTLETITTDLTWNLAGDSKREFNTGRLDIHATWERPRGGQTPVLTGAEIRARDGQLHFAGHKINKITIDRNGVIHLDRDGIDATIYKITRKANGDLVLDLPWYLLGDKTIKKADLGAVDIRNWPPTLEELVTIMTAIARDDSDEPATTHHQGTFNWRAQGRTRPSPLPFGDGSLVAATTFDVRGAARLEPDGTFRTIGNQNTATVALEVGDTRFRRDTGNLDVDVRSGSGRFNGRYAIAMPAGQDFALTVDGDVRYTVDADAVTLQVPSGTRIRAEDSHLRGDGRLTGSFGAGGTSVVLRDGTYRLDVNGPLGISGLKVGNLTVDDITGRGTVRSTGTLEELSSDRLAFHGSAEGDLDVESRGIRGALSGEDEVETNLRRGSRLHFDLENVDVETTLPGTEGRPVQIDLDAERGTVDGSLDFERTRVRTGDVTADLGRVDGRLALDVEGLTVGGDEGSGIRRVTGSASANVVEGGNLTYNGLPDAPVGATDEGLPGAPVVRQPQTRSHRVVSGDTLGALARRYGVSLDRLRAANGIAPTSSLIRVGETLVIPGAPTPEPVVVAPPAPVRPSGETAPGRWTTEVRPGTQVDLTLDEASIGPGGLRARGTVAARLDLSGSDVRTGSVQAKILGAARAALPATAFSVDGSTVQLEAGAAVQVPVRISLDPGSTVKVDIPGRGTNLVFDREGSYAEFTVNVVRGPNGQLQVDQLKDVDVVLRSDGTLTSAGDMVDVSGNKTVKYTGKMVFVRGGIDFYGKMTVEVEGDANTPALRIRW